MLCATSLHRARQSPTGCQSHSGSHDWKKGACLKATVVLLLVAMSPTYMWATQAEIGVKEIVFACRQPGAGGHWYENFGYYAQNKNKKAYRGKGRLCRLNVANGELTVSWSAPSSGIEKA